MALIDKSIISSKTVGSYSQTSTDNALLNNQSTGPLNLQTAGDQLFGTVTKVPAAIADGITTQVNNATSFAEGYGKQLTSVVNGVGTTISNAESAVEGAISSLETGASKIFGAVTGGLSSAFNDITTGVFGDSSANNTKATTLKTATPDVVASSFTSGTPKSNLFKTTSATTGLVPSNLSGQKTSTGDTSILGSKILAGSRYGTEFIGDTVKTIRSGISAVTHSSIVSGLYSGISDVVGTATSVRATIQSTISSVGATTSAIYNGGLSAYRSMVGDTARLLTGNSLGLDGFFNSSLTQTTDANGNAIAGVPSELSTPGITGLYSAAKSLGCDVGNFDFTAYGAQQSLLGALLGITAQTNMTNLLNNLMNCNRFSGYGIDISKQLFYQNAGVNVGSSSTILSNLGGSQIATTPALTKTIVTNPNLTSSDSGTVSSMLGTLGTTNNYPYLSATQIGGNDLWDASTIDGSNISADLLTGGYSDLAMMSGGEVYA